MTRKGDIITIRGNRDLWIDFTYKIKKQKKKVWDVLEKVLKDYIKNN